MDLLGRERTVACGRSNESWCVGCCGAADHVGMERLLRLSRVGASPPSRVSRTY